MSETEAVTEPKNLEGQLTDLIGAVINPEEQPQEGSATEAETETDETVDVEVGDHEAAEEIDKAEESDGSEDPEWYQKRIKRFTRQLRTVEAERDEALAEIEAMKEQTKSAPVAEPSRITARSEKDLIELENLEKEKIKFAREQKRLIGQGQLDDVLENIKSAGKEMDPDSDESLVRSFLDEIIDDSRDSLSFEIPKRRTELAHKVQLDQVAEQKYPWLNQPESDEMEYFKAVVKASPALANVPSGKLEIARYVTGLMAETTAQELVAQGRKRKAPKAPVRNNAAPAAKPKDDDSISKAAKRVQKTGSVRDLDSLLLAGLTRH
tara:strand:- start:2332 stop:3300 length:969 start_codon:yes stop_codon:yes gene_type:complete